jgi:Protein of unknown function (DUF1573)
MTMMLRSTLVLLTALLVSTGTASATSWADALFDDLTHDFGASPYGATVRRVFTIANTTGQKVRIASVRVSCGCVSAAVTRRELAPGEKASLVVSVDTRRFKGATTKSVYVRFDQPEDTEVRLSISANSRDDLALAPASLAFLLVASNSTAAPSGESKAAGVTVTMGDSACNVLAATCESEYIQPSVALLSRQAAGVSYQVSAKLRATPPAGTYYSTVWLTTNSAAMPRVAVPVIVEVKAPSGGAAMSSAATR